MLKNIRAICPALPGRCVLVRTLVLGLAIMLPVVVAARPRLVQEVSPGSSRPPGQSAQQTGEVYENRVYLPEIRSVQLYNSDEEQSLPVLELGGGGTLLLSFDDLRGGFHDFYYTVEHCTAEWKASGLPQIQYLKGFPGERIRDYRSAANTYQQYTNYQLEIPDFSIEPLISGNYILKIYQDNDPEKLVLTRRFYVLERKVSIEAEAVRSSRVNEREKRQKLNLSIFHPNLPVSNPFGEVKVYVSQNGREDKAQWLTRPVYVRASQLVYDATDMTDFYGGNEFRRFDLRSLRFQGEGVASIVHDDLFIASLVVDEPRLSQAYSSLIDNNGKYFVRFQEGSAPETEADYARVNFRFSAPPVTGNYYVFGGLTDWELKEDFKMIYDPASQTHQAIPLLKQGVYDYIYVHADASGAIDDLDTESDHYETENDYYIFVYYRRTGSRYDELVGYSLLNTADPRR